ncbi:MAG TPA: VOC family protein [Xanthobacteraceae bacterium]|jgi:catechol 2,3-dioxygenase-like lactoylglutathione lyase family enzyme
MYVNAARPKEFAHILLKVYDIDRSRRFYIDLLGFELRKASPLPDGRPFVPFVQGLALTNGGPQQPQQIDHIAFKAENVRAITERLKKANVKFFRDLHNGIYGLTIYISDPDGNMIELYEEDATL